MGGSGRGARLRIKIRRHGNTPDCGARDKITSAHACILVRMRALQNGGGAVFCTRIEKMAASSAFLAVLLLAVSLREGDGVEKIQIDPITRLYRGSSDGRVYMFHGLDTEDSSPPWYLRTLDQSQIDLMKTVI